METEFSSEFHIDSELVSQGLHTNNLMFYTKEGLSNALEKNSIDFVIISKKYQKYSKLEESDRNKIAKLVINQLLISNVDRLLTKAEYIHLSTIIVTIFPTEDKDTYYCPSKGKSIRAGGKLLSALMNFRVELNEVGLIERKKKDNTSSVLATIEPTENIEEAEQLLRIIDVNDDIVNLWNITRELRKQILSEIGLQEYFKRYSCLNSDQAIELILLDANDVYFSKNNMKFNEFNYKAEYTSFSRAVTELAKSSKAKPIKDLISKANIYDSDARLILSLQLLAYMLPPKTLKRKNSTSLPQSVRSTQLSVFKSFLPIFVDQIEADLFFLTNEKDTPHIYFIGDLQNIELIIAKVQIVSKVFVFNDPLEAINFCFASFLALDTQYPNLSAHVWTIIQQVIYKLYLEKDKINEVSRNISLRREILNFLDNIDIST